MNNINYSAYKADQIELSTSYTNIGKETKKKEYLIQTKNFWFELEDIIHTDFPCNNITHHLDININNYFNNIQTYENWQTIPFNNSNILVDLVSFRYSRHYDHYYAYNYTILDGIFSSLKFTIWMKLGAICIRILVDIDPFGTGCYTCKFYPKKFKIKNKKIYSNCLNIDEKFITLKKDIIEKIVCDVGEKINLLINKEKNN